MELAASLCEDISTRKIYGMAIRIYLDMTERILAVQIETILI